MAGSLPWIDCEYCGAHLFKGILTEGSAIEVPCRKDGCKRLNTIGPLSTPGELVPDGTGGFKNPTDASGGEVDSTADAVLG